MQQRTLPRLFQSFLKTLCNSKGEGFISLENPTLYVSSSRFIYLGLTNLQGRFLPVFASVIYDQNTRLVNAGLEPINLASLMLGILRSNSDSPACVDTVIGNGLTDSLTMTLARYDMMCTKTSLDPILDIGTCVSLKKTASRFLSALNLTLVAVLTLDATMQTLD